MSLTRTLYYAMPPALRFMARRLYYLPTDVFESLSGKRGDMIPPKGLIFTGGGDFEKTGQLLVNYLKEFGGLQSNHSLLDVGSGIGRVAIPLTQYLKEEGRYEGFDVTKMGVQWCQKNISPKFPNFQFQYIPLENDLYRASGEDASSFQFPYDDGTFHCSVVNSVFTHMIPAQVENYIKEIARVLQPGGICYATFFIFGESPIAKKALKGFDFPHDFGHYKLMDEKVKSANVAYEESWLKDLLKINGLKIKHLFWGSWHDLPSKECKEFQDIVIIEKG